MIPCRECGKDSGWSRELINSELFGGNENVAVCDPCVENYHRSQREENYDKPDLSRAPIEELIPIGYRETDATMLPASAKANLHSIMKWIPDYGKGLYLLGDTRQGKTRTMCLLLKELYRKNYNFKVFFAGDFHSKLAQAKQTQFYRSWFEEVISTPILCIDDLFAEKLTPTSQAGLFEIIEQRMSRKLPNIITTQVKRSDAIKLFEDPNRGKAFLERLREISTLYTFNSEVLQEKLAV